MDFFILNCLKYFPMTSNCAAAIILLHKRFVVTALAAATSKPALRPYQQECIDICLSEYQKGIRRQAVSLPVGSGKTVNWNI